MAGNEPYTLAELVLSGPVHPVPVPANGGSGQVLGKDAVLFGWSLRETTGTAAATVEIIDGGDGTGQKVAEISLAAGDTDTRWLGVPGVQCKSGVYLHVISGNVTGAVWASC